MFSPSQNKSYTKIIIDKSGMELIMNLLRAPKMEIESKWKCTQVPTLNSRIVKT